MEETKEFTSDDNKIIDDIRKLRTMKEVFEFIVQKYPDWIIGFCDNYSEDYPHFYKNWKQLSEVSKVKPQKIILVKHFENDDQLSFSELLFTAGFVVRTISEFGSCPVCKLAIPREISFKKLKEINHKDVSIPDIWSEKCRKCL